MRQLAFRCGFILLVLGGALLGSAWLALPRAGERAEAAWWSIPSFAVVIKAEGDRVVPVYNAMWPTEFGDAMYVGEIFVDELVQEAPPGFGWLWGEWVTRLRCRGGQQLVLASWSPDTLPSGAKDDIEEIVRTQINDGRYADRERVNPGTIQKMLDISVPIQVEMSNPEVTWAMPEFDADVPMNRLWIASALSAVACIFVLLSLVCGVTWLIGVATRR